MAESSTTNKVCFLCGEHGHFNNECPWLNYQCEVCQKAPMRLFLCKQGHDIGRRFLRYTTQPKCDVFLWFDGVKKKLATKREDVVKEKGEEKVKLTVDGKTKMVFEGNVDDLCKIVHKLGLN